MKSGVLGTFGEPPRGSLRSTSDRRSLDPNHGSPNQIFRSPTLGRKLVPFGGVANWQHLWRWGSSASVRRRTLDWADRHLFSSRSFQERRGRCKAQRAFHKLHLPLLGCSRFAQNWSGARGSSSCDLDFSALPCVLLVYQDGYSSSIPSGFVLLLEFGACYHLGAPKRMPGVAALRRETH